MKMKWLFLLVALVSAFGCTPKEQTEAPASPNVERKPEASAPPPTQMAFHKDDLGPTLTKVAALMESGFDKSDADKLAKEVLALKSGDHGHWDYEVTYKGRQAQLKVHADGSNDETPVVQFDTADAELLKAIEGAM